MSAVTPVRPSDAASGIAALRRAVRELLAETPFTPRTDSWMRGFDPELSATLGQRGWLGLTWPEVHGGGGRSAVERLVVTEELLRAGAPVTAHWTAERQIGPAVVRHGTPEQRSTLLPAIRRGRVVVGLGMSESEAGSDLAAVRTRAVEVDGGWEITGTKIWTTSGHRATHFYVLARTSTGERRQDGLTEFLVDADTPGITVRPILDLVGEHHFNEVHFEGVAVPGGRVLGEVGQGWRQVTEQLAFERGGAERYLSTYVLVPRMLEAARRRPGRPDRAVSERIGALAARLTALRRLGLELTRTIDAGGAPTLQAAELKLLGTAFEKEVVEHARYVLDVCPAGPDAHALLLDGIASVPGGTIRGGVSAVMRTIVSRSEEDVPSYSENLRDVVDDVLAPGFGDDPTPRTTDSALWAEVVSLDWPLVGVPEECGGAGGDLADVSELAAGVGRQAAGIPLIETGLAAWVLAVAGVDVDLGAVVADGACVAVAGDGELMAGPDARDARAGSGPRGWQLSGTLTTVRWLPAVPWVVVVADVPDGTLVALLSRDAEGVHTAPGRDLAEEPVGRLTLDGVRVSESVALAPDALLGDLVARTALLRVAALGGAAARATALVAEHVRTREQFGRPLAAFQVVAHALADLVVERDLIAAGLRAALDAPSLISAAAARVAAARSASTVAEGAHQLAGAMGITREFGLHLLTRRLWSWRDGGGAEGTARRWEHWLGARLLAGGDDTYPDAALWDLVVAE